MDFQLIITGKHNLSPLPKVIPQSERRKSFTKKQPRQRVKAGSGEELLTHAAHEHHQVSPDLPVTLQRVQHGARRLGHSQNSMHVL